MHILFLSHYFPPEVNAPATRTFEHCREWVKAGHQVTVISCVPNHPMGKLYNGYKNKFYQKEEVEGILLIRVLTYVTPNEGFAKRTTNYVFYMCMAIIASIFVKKPDVVISTSPQFFNGLAGYFVSRMKRVKWVFEVRDLWPDSIVAVGALGNYPRVVKFLEYIERFAYRKADHIVSVTQSFVSHIKENGGENTPITVIYNGVDPEKFKPMPRTAELEKKYGVEGKFVAAYVGTHGLAHGLETLVEAAELLKDSPHIHIITAGEGAMYQPLVDDIQRRGLSNITMLGQLPKEDMPGLWSVSDISLVLLKPHPLFKSVIPSKMFESMAMNKPIVLGVEGESRQIVTQHQAGVAVEPGCADSLARAICDLFDGGSKPFGGRIRFRKSMIDNFSRHKLAISYLDLLIQRNASASLRKS